MKKTVLFIIAYCSVCITKADEIPYVESFFSKDSIVWILVSKNYSGGNPGIYRIDFHSSGKITWSEERDNEICMNVLDAKRYIKGKPVYDKKSNLFWIVNEEQLRYGKPDVWTGVAVIPRRQIIEVSALHIGDDSKVWVGGYAFVGYYHNRIFTRIFFIDNYALQGTFVEICEEGKECPEEKEPDPEDYDNIEDYDEAIGGLYGDGYPSSVCFCDGRKIGYINDADGYVNFRSAPDAQAPIIGVILDRVRVFYRDDGNNGNWYKVEVNDVEGYVHKSRIRS
jgi:hypothetical protein